MFRTRKLLGSAALVLSSVQGDALKTTLLSRARTALQGLAAPDAERTLMTLDTNHDGFVDRNEVSAFAASQGLDPQAAIADFASLDVNGDGKLDAQELAGALGSDPEASESLAPAPIPQASQPVMKRQATSPQTPQKVRPQRQERQPPTHQESQPEAMVAEIMPSEDMVPNMQAITSQSDTPDVTDETSAMAARIAQELSTQEETEAEAHQLDSKAGELRANLTISAQGTAERARKAGREAAHKKAVELMKKIEKLEAGAQKAEVAAAALRAKAKAELSQADELMEVANTALKSA